VLCHCRNRSRVSPRHSRHQCRCYHAQFIRVSSPVAARYAFSASPVVKFINAIRAEDPGFLNGTEFGNKPDTDLFGPLGLRSIPLQEIGLYPDAALSGWQQEGLPDFPKQ
jgi:hypothetical protein